MPTDYEQIQANIALVDDARVAEHLSNIGTLLSPAEQSQLRSYANGAAGFNLLMAEVGLDVARRNAGKAERPDIEDLSIRMAVARFYQGLILQEEQARASELGVN